MMADIRKIKTVVAMGHIVAADSNVFDWLIFLKRQLIKELSDITA